MTDDQPPTGIKRILVRALAYLRIGIWMGKELNPWRKA
ncbi:hypothetical protein OCOJLMKI_3758 [Methylobacterium iners]|uniref:Uncharacterized protein n=1 Tax=Methylobacterium iners TaxID=418707 RepID=A0ABQ4S0N6_9HYPH|nr:hypothetical protein OCOJLMKI_3758 [Methylobacterium iners]